jgi:phosphoribosylformylglycinamidine synthase
MVLDVPPRNVATVLDVFRRYDVPATEVGEFSPGPFEELTYDGLLVGRLRLSFRVAPVAVHRRVRRPRPSRRAAPKITGNFLEVVRDLLLAPDSVSRERVVRVYEHEVGGRTVVKPMQGRIASPSHGDASVLRPRSDQWSGLAVTVAAQPWACQEDPRRGAAWVVEEAARNLYAVGARPDALTNCLNFGNPEDAKVLGDFAEVVRGLSEAARAFDMAVPSGNVSFYNGGLGHGILPTPVLMATGLVPDVRHATTTDLKAEGDPLYLVGTTSPELGGSLYARRHRLRGYRIPPTNPRGVRELGERLLRATDRGYVRAAHDVSDGGLAVAVPEMAFGGGLGFSVDLAAAGLEDPLTSVVAEGGSRWVVEVDAGEVDPFERLFAKAAVAPIGSVAKAGGRFIWGARELARLDLAQLYAAWKSGLDG